MNVAGALAVDGLKLLFDLVCRGVKAAHGGGIHQVKHTLFAAPNGVRCIGNEKQAAGTQILIARVQTALLVGVK